MPDSSNVSPEAEDVLLASAFRKLLHGESFPYVWVSIDPPILTVDGSVSWNGGDLTAEECEAVLRVRPDALASDEQ